VFFALAPIAALGALLVIASVPTSRDPQAPPADRAGLALSTAAMALLIYTIIEAPNHGWTAGRTVGGFVLALSLLGAFIAWERPTPAPMLDVGLFRNLRFSAASGAVTIAFFSLMGFIFLVTLYFQFLKGYGPLSPACACCPSPPPSGSPRWSARSWWCAAAPSWSSQAGSWRSPQASPGPPRPPRARAT
jgi:hypothetical protein